MPKVGDWRNVNGHEFNVMGGDGLLGRWLQCACGACQWATMPTLIDPRCDCKLCQPCPLAGQAASAEATNEIRAIRL